MNIPVSLFYSITKANGNDVVKLPSNSFRWFLTRSFDALRYGAMNNYVYSLVSRPENADNLDMCYFPINTMASMIVKAIRDDIECGNLSLKEVAEYNWSEIDWNDYTYPTDSRVNHLKHVLDSNEVKDPAVVEEIAKLESEQAAMFADFVEMAKYLSVYYAAYVAELDRKFENDEGLSYDEMTEVLIESDRKEYLIAIAPDCNIITKVWSVERHVSMFGNYASYEHNVSAFNGKTYLMKPSTKYIPEYSGILPPSKIGFFIPSETDETVIVERSTTIVNLNKQPAYMFHTGTLTEREGWFSSEYPATGRCMVDLKTMMQINPNFGDFYPRFIKESTRETVNVDLIADINQMDREMILCMSPYVYFFSFVAKKWGRTLVTNISNIKFREDAFEKLIIEEDVKDFMFSLVDQSKGEGVQGQDIIDNKGGGSIFLLAGKPGIGKTITAETMAETLKRPLYMVGVGELGTDARSLESNLARVLNTAAAWNAILLLDECDIFMEERKNMDVHRNAMVGVFLRLLEYYPGILFLTTNRADNIDAAFFSRISLAVQYPELNNDKRFIIWNNILNLYKNHVDLSSIDVKSLSHLDINGRQIKNAVRLVVAYCDYKNKTPTTEDFMSIVEKSLKFTEKK